MTISREEKIEACKDISFTQNKICEYTHIQNLLLNIGKSGCLFLCLTFIAENFLKKSVDFVSLARVAYRKGWLTEDFYIKDSLAILKEATGREWRRKIIKNESDESTAEPYALIEKWVQPNGITHFTPAVCNIYKDSVTMKVGYLMEYYAYELVK